MGHQFTSFLTFWFLCICLLALSLAGKLDAAPCNFYKGRWILDESYPLYDASKCTIATKHFNCQKNGRPDNMYLKYRWKPTGCELPRFNGVHFLEKFRGKNIVFIGDSLSLNAWQSLSCMLHTSVPQANYTMAYREGGLSEFTLPDYGVSVMLSSRGFLVDYLENGKILKLDKINGTEWKHRDVLVFNSWHWWLFNTNETKWNQIILKGNKTYKEIDRKTTYLMALKKWGKWINKNINPKKTRVFWQTLSPIHGIGREWNEPGATCANQTLPVSGSTYQGDPNPGVKLIKNFLSKRVKKPVELLDITALSQLRKDGHPSIYGFSPTKVDCGHWCLGGIPDTWNEILLASLLNEIPK